MTRAKAKVRAAARHDVVVVGGNFAGLSAALELPGDCDVAVVDPHPWFEWLPNVHELVSGVKRPSDLRLPRRAIVEHAGHRFVHGRVTGIDGRARTLRLEDGRRLSYEHCVLAIGGVSNDYGVPGAAEHAMPFKNVDQCAAIGARLRRLAAAPGQVSVVVVGGGFEGIEAAGEVLRAYRQRPDLEVHLVELGERLMPEGPPAVDELVRRRAAGLPLHVHCGERVERVTARRVVLASGRRLPSDLTIWTGGATAPPLVGRRGVPRSPAGWIRVAPDLSCGGLAGVFAAGDVADPPRRLAKQAYHAIDMGAHAARNVLRQRRGKRTVVFAPSEKPMLVAFGDLDTFLITDSRVIASPLLAAAKEAVFEVTIAGFDVLGSRAGLERAGRRGARAVGELLWPKLVSPREWGKLLNLRMAGGGRKGTGDHSPP